MVCDVLGGLSWLHKAPDICLPSLYSRNFWDMDSVGHVTLTSGTADVQASPGSWDKEQVQRKAPVHIHLPIVHTDAPKWNWKSKTSPVFPWSYVGMPHSSRSVKGEQEADFVVLVLIFFFYFAEATFLTLASNMQFIPFKLKLRTCLSFSESDFHPIC